MNNKGYLKLYLYSLAELALAAIVVAMSQALDVNADKYYAKLFIIGTTLFFYAASVLISHGDPGNLDFAEFKEIGKTIYADSPLFGKIIQIAFPVLGFALSVYIMILDKWILAPGFAKLSAFILCAGLIIRALIDLIYLFIKKGSPEEFDESVSASDGEEKEKPPVFIFVLTILIAGIACYYSASSFFLNDVYGFTSSYKVANGLKNSKVKKIFNEDFLNKEVKFSLGSGYGDDYFYYMYLDQDDSQSFVKDKVSNILKRAVEENVEFVFVDSKDTYEFSGDEIKQLLGSSYKEKSNSDLEDIDTLEAEGFGGYFINDTSDTEKLLDLARMLYDSESYVVLDISNMYEHQYIPAWDIPAYCTLSGIDISNDGWQDELQKSEPFIASMQNVFYMICNNPEYENCNGLLLGFGTDSPLLIPHNTLCEVWKEKNPVVLEEFQDSETKE